MTGQGDWLHVQPDMIPPPLRALGWVLWRAEPRGDEKPAKVPHQIADPERKAKSTDPMTWGTFPDAVEAYSALVAVPAHPRLGPIAGIGVVLTRAAGITCLDLDRVLHGNTLDPRAAQLVRAFDSWTERSPSGTGLHVFVRGRLPKAIKGHQIEVYGTDRYICVTGHQWPETPGELADRQVLLDRLSTVDAPAPRPLWTGPCTPPPDDLGGALLAKVHAWDLTVVGPLKRWQDGFLIELARCPWASDHTTGLGGSAVLIRASGAYDFVCLHAHCGRRTWRDFRAAFLAEADPPAHVIFPEFLPSGVIMLMHGEPRSRKSLAALELALSAATGTSPFGLERFRPSEPVPVFWIQEEDPRSLTRPRVRRLVTDRCGDSVPATLYVSVRRGVNLDDPEWVRRLIEDLTRLGVRLLVLDAARRFSAKTDEGPAKVREFTAVLRHIVTTTGVSIVIVHTLLSQLARIAPEDRTIDWAI